MINSQDAVTIQKALNAQVAAGELLPSQATDLINRLIAMIPASAPTVPQLRCQKCGRAQNDPQNADCDMQPCTFV